MSSAKLLAAGAAVAVLVFAALHFGGRSEAPLRPGSAAPSFELPELDASVPRRLAADRGKVVLINFWATWCKPCLDEMPAMQRLYDALPREDFELLAISVDESEEPVRAFRDRLEIRFPILLDRDKSVAERYQTFRFPESVLIDREGRVRARYIGPKEWDSDLYREHLEGLIRAGPS